MSSSPSTRKVTLTTTPLQPILTLGSVPGRKEVQILEDWLQLRIKNLEISDPSYYHDVNILYEFALLELIRQISIDCSERGAMLLRMFETFKQNHMKIQQQMKSLSLEEQAELRLQLVKEEEQSKKYLGEVKDNDLAQAIRNVKEQKLIEIIEANKKEICSLKEENTKVVQDYKTFMRQYEKCLVQTDAAINFIKSCDVAPAKNGKNESVEKIHEIFMIQHKVAVKSLEQKGENKPKVEPIINVREDVGVAEFAIPKLKRTIRKTKKPLLYHSYSMDDIRYAMNCEAQTDPIQFQKEESHSPKKDDKNIHGSINEVIKEASMTQEMSDSQNEINDSMSPREKQLQNDEHPSEINIEKTPNHPKVVFNLKRTNTITKATFLKLCKTNKMVLPLSNNDNNNNLTPNAKTVAVKSKDKGSSIGSMINLFKIDSHSSRQSNDNVKEIDSLVNENNQKKGCIDELVEENMRLYKELEAVQNELDTLKEANQIEKTQKEMKLRPPSASGLNDSSEMCFKELEKYEPVLIKGNSIKKAKKNTQPQHKKKCSEGNNPCDFIADFLIQYNMNKKSIIQIRMPLKSLIRSMNAIYNQIITTNKEVLAKTTNAFSVKNKLPKLFYDMLFLKYGNQAFAINKFKAYIATGMYYQQIPRVHIFNGLMGISNDLEENDINIYIRAMSYIAKLKSGVTIPYSDTAERQFIPYIRGVDACRQFFMSSLNKDLYTEFIKKVENNKVTDKTKVNTSGIIELDVLIMIFIEQYHMLLGKIRHYIYDIFKASDLDGSNSIDFFEFYVIFINIEAESFSYEKCRQIFSHSCEYSFQSTQQPLVSFNQFAAICHSHNLFSEAAQNKYLRYFKADEFIRLVEILGNNFEDIYSIFMQRLEELLNSSEYLNKMLQTIKECSSRVNNAREAKPVWMMYKFIENVSCQLYTDRMIASIIGDFEILIENKQPSTLQLLQLKENGGSSLLFESIAY